MNVKKTTAAVMAVMLALAVSLVGCDYEAEGGLDNRFRVDHEEYCFATDGDILVLTDTETGVRYLCVGGEGVTPLLDKEAGDE